MTRELAAEEMDSIRKIDHDIRQNISNQVYITKETIEALREEKEIDVVMTRRHLKSLKEKTHQVLDQLLELVEKRSKKE